MRKRIGVFILCFVLALTAGLVVACADVQVDKNAAKQYTVTYYYNYDGAPTGGVYREDKVKDKTPAQKPANPSRTDYTFDKWTTDAAGKTAAYTFTEAVTSDVKLYAQWTAKAAVTFSDIIIAAQPTKLEYVQGEDLDFTGIVVKAKYSNGTEEKVDITQCAVSGYDKTKLGQQTVTLTYNKKTADFKVTVVAPELDRIEITTQPTNTEYISGEKLDLTGMVVTAYYKNNTSTVITDYTVTGYVSTTAGEQTVTVEYNGKTATFTVTVKAIQVIGIEITTNPTKLEYEVGEELDLTGMVVTATYNDHSTKPVKNEDCEVEGFTSATAGSPTVTVKYRGFEDEFTVTVIQVTYKVTFVTGVDGIAAPAAQTVNKNGHATNPTTTAISDRAGYTFNGWFADGAVTAYAFATTAVTGNITLTAKWTARTYTITYIIDNDADGNPLATAPTTNLNYTVETNTFSLPAPTAIKEGYNFLGWYSKYTVVDGVKTYDDADRVTTIAKGTTTGNKTFYAYIDEKATYDFKFNYNCDDESHIDTVPVQEGKKPTAPTAPTRNGYTFGGWYTTAACTTEYVFDKNIEEIAEENRVAYAKWTAKQITVTFDAKNDTEATTAQVAFDAAVTEPAEPTLLGHEFKGWFRLNGDEWDFDKKLCEVLTTEALTLEAKWEAKKYSVVFKPDNGGADITVENVTFGTALGDKMPTAPTKTGYTFDGWRTAGGTTWTASTVLNTEGVTLTAKWNANTYTVAFDTKGGTPAVDPKQVKFGEKVTAPTTAPTKAGYTLDGWYTAETCDCTGVCTHKWNFDTDTLQTTTLTLIARWSAIDVVVKFVDNDGTTAFAGIPDQTIKYGQKATKPTDPTKTGYTLLHWHLLDGETVWDFDDAVTRANGKLTLVAHWQAATYTITYVMGDKATAIADGSYTYSETDAFELPSSTMVNVTEAGYSFIGWYDAETGGNRVSTIAAGTTGNKTFYARIEQNQTVKFTYNYGYEIANREDNIVQGTTAEDIKPTRAGYTFDGWYTTEALTAKFDFTKPINAATTVYAKWTPVTYTVTFDAQNGTDPVEKKFTSEQAITALSPAPEKTGYTFKYWYIEDEDTAYTFGNKPTANFTLHAKWEINKYTVTFNSQGGGDVAPVEVTYGNKFDKPANPTRTGYTFGGWFRDAACSEDQEWSFAADSTDTVVGDITLYAKWTINKYTVTFDVNGGVGTVEAQQIEYNKRATEPTVELTKEGYHQDGWITVSGDKWNFETGLITRNYTLKANWIINTYTVTFNSNGGTAVESQTVNHDGKATAPADPTREGWEFTGWNLNGSAYDFDTPVTGNITLSAGWSGKTGTYLYVSDVNGENWNAKYTAVKNGTKNEWKIDGVELYVGMQFAVVTYGTQTTSDKWLHAAATISQYGGFDSIIEIGTVKSNPDDADNNDYNFVVLSYNAQYNGAKWTVYIVGLNGDGTVSSGISFEQYFENNELRDPSNTGKTPTNIEVPVSGTNIYIRGNFTNEFGLSPEWSSESTAIKVLKPLSDSSEYTFRKVYLKQGDAFKVFLTSYAEGSEYGKCWFGGMFTGLNTVITMSNDNAPNIYLGGIETGYYDLIIDRAANTLKIVKWAAPTTATVTIATQPTQVEYYVGEPFSSTGLVVTATNTDRETTTLTAAQYDMTDTATITNSVGTKTITVTYGGKSATFTITVKALTVTFESNGGSEVAQQSLSYNGKATKPTPTKLGYDFGGWFTNEACTGAAYDFDTAVIASITLYAKWTDHYYTVVFKDDNNAELATLQVKHGTAITSAQVPAASKTGYTFTGWKNGTEDYTIGTEVTSDLTLVAQFRINTYTVTFVYYDRNETQDVNYNTLASKPSYNKTTRTGYTFDGWYKESTYATEWQFTGENADKVTGDVSIYGKWTIVTYTITYNVECTDDDGNTLGVAPTTNTTYTVETATFNLPKPTSIPAGYTFMGWFVNQDLSGTAVSQIAKGSTGNRVYYAKITQNDAVYLTFDLNYEGAEEVEPMPVVSGTAGSALDPEPTREGYTFKGWFEDVKGTTEYTFPAMTVGKTVYAKWEINKYTVTFNTALGSAVAKKENIEHGSKIEAPADPTYADHDFMGWYKSTDFKDENKWNFETDTVTNNITLHAYWVETKYTVTFMNGATEVKKLENIGKNSVISAPTPAPTKTGHTLVGWFTAEECECGETCTHKWNFDTDKVTEDTTLYARWSKNSYTVTFNLNYTGAPANDTATVEYGANVTKPADPTRKGYKFDGWYKESTCTTVWKFTGDNADTMPAAALNLYAKWTIKTFTVAYYIDGSKVETAIAGCPTQYKITDGSVTLGQPEKVGFTFDGWYGNGEYTGDKVTTLTYDDIFADITDVNTTVVPLYARYIQNSYIVTFDLNYTGSTNPTATVLHGNAVATADIPTNPKREGFTFDDWYTDKECTTLWVRTTPITGKTTVYAKWTSVNKQTGAYLNGVFVKEISSNNGQAIDVEFQLKNAYLTSGLLTFYYNNSMITTSISVRSNSPGASHISNKDENGATLSAGTLRVVDEGVYDIYYAKSKGDETGLWVVYTAPVTVTEYMVTGSFINWSYSAAYVFNAEGTVTLTGATTSTQFKVAKVNNNAVDWDSTSFSYGNVTVGKEYVKQSGDNILFTVAGDYIIKFTSSCEIEITKTGGGGGGGGESDDREDGLYAGETKLTVTEMKENPDNAAELMILGLVVPADATVVTLVYGGKVATFDANAGSGGKYASLATNSVTFNKGTYDLYYTASTGKLWVNEVVVNEGGDKNASLTYESFNTDTGVASVAHVVGKFFSRSMSGFEWAKGYTMSGTTNNWTLKNIYLYVGDEFKVRAGTGTAFSSGVYCSATTQIAITGNNMVVKEGYEGYYTVSYNGSTVTVTYHGATAAA